jgi:GntR family transcriptional regulator
LCSLVKPWPVTLCPVEINPRSPEHTYVQLARLLRERIASGEITDMLPSIMELTEETGLAVGTVRRAIGVLIDEGLVVTQPGRGTFVRPQ